MRDPEQLAATLSRRLQASLDNKISAKISDINAFKTGPRGVKYKIKAPKESSVKIVSLGSEQDGEYIRTGEGMSIKPEWCEIYEMVCHSKVPHHWHHVFAKRDDIDDDEKARAAHHSLKK